MQPQVEPSILSGYGKAFAALRGHEVTQVQLGNKAEVSSTTISRIETGKYAPGLETTARLLSALGLDWHDWAKAMDEAQGKMPRDTAIKAKKVNLSALVELVQGMPEHEAEGLANLVAAAVQMRRSQGGSDH